MDSEHYDDILTRVLYRLEAATSRLEDIASTTGAPADASRSLTAGPEDASKASSINGGLGATKAIPGPPSSTSSTISLPPSVEAFDTLVNDELNIFSDISSNLGGTIEEQAKSFSAAFKSQRDVLLVASKAKEPSQTSPVYRDVLKDLIEGIESVNGIRDKNRKSPQENHLSMIADGSGVLSWVTMKPSPDKYVAEVLGGAQFYGNKILSAFKGKDTQDVEWVKAFVKLCGALMTYIKEHHPKGLEWNVAGIPADEALRDVKAAPKTNGTAAPSAGGGPPPPPPPPPLPQFDIPPPPPPPAAPTSDMGAVFDQLNRGESVTSGLRKVDKSEMTHKNPALRAQGTGLERSDSGSSAGRAKSPQPPAKKQKPESMRTKKPPRKELEGNKWTIENFENESSPIEIEAERSQSILISKCKATTISVKGKANAISVDNCSRLDMLMESLVSSVDVINSNNFRMQVLGTLPSVQLDKVDGGIIFLSKESLETEVYTSKCTSINITLPPASEQDDSVECPVPEQLRSTIVDGKLVTEIVKQEG